MFDSTKKSLKDLLEKARNGALQLPDFQRGWVWSDEDIKSLLVSVAQSFPVGALMTLEAGGDINFKPRVIEGVDSHNSTPDALLLDGQQRITSLFQATMQDNAIETTNAQKRKVKRLYYFDMVKMLEDDFEGAIISVPESRRTTRAHNGGKMLDLTTEEKEFENIMFPTNKMFNFRKWRRGFEEYWQARDSAKREIFSDFDEKIIAAFEQFQLPVIALSRDVPKNAVCRVFEKVNTSGKQLDTFDLLTAIYAANDFELRKDWYGDPDSEVLGRSHRIKENKSLSEIANTDFLQAISLYHTRNDRVPEEQTNDKRTDVLGGACTCTRVAILSLPLEAYTAHAGKLEKGFFNAAKFLWSQKIFSAKDLPYRTQVVPLATILADLGNLWDEEHVREKVTKWYWCGVFGELYGASVETRAARDVVEVRPWIEGGEEPSTVVEANFRIARLDTMRRRNSAAYKGVHALLMSGGARDLITGRTIEEDAFWDESIDIHHIFPKAWCDKNGVSVPKRESIVNKTPLYSRTNKIIGRRAPSAYLADLQNAMQQDDRDRIDEHLVSHKIEPEHLRNDNFDAFFASRKQSLYEMILRAMGKTGEEEDGLISDEGEEELQPEDLETKST